jgi:molecular chaperone GrpE
MSEKGTENDAEANLDQDQTGDVEEVEELVVDETIEDGDSKDLDQDQTGDVEEVEELAVEETDEDGDSEDLDPLAQALLEVESYKDRYLRAAAELDNFRKRTARTRSEVREETLRDALLQFAPVMDNMRRALDQDTQGVDLLKEGIELIYDQLCSAFSTYGLEPIEAIDSVFDPNLHEAMMEVADPERNPGTVIQEMEKGYTLNGKVVRPSRVVVSKVVEEEDSPDGG